MSIKAWKSSRVHITNRSFPIPLQTNPYLAKSTLKDTLAMLLACKTQIMFPPPLLVSTSSTAEICINRSWGLIQSKINQARRSSLTTCQRSIIDKSVFCQLIIYWFRSLNVRVLHWHQLTISQKLRKRLQVLSNRMIHR